MSETRYGYCRCGCGQKTTIARQNHEQHGWVRGEPLKWSFGHHLRKSPVPYVEEARGYDTPCWIWQGAARPEGYGNIRRSDGTYVSAHRFYFERARGLVPNGLHLDHLCRIPACVNPDHLEAVTPAENARRASKLNWDVVREIRTNRDRIVDLARRYEVSWDTVWAVRTGRSWVEGESGV